ncbi:MAG: D-2-hydroxyacid dehydrogenase [Clostridia bacterium]|nr:D-2-hydroxyacid dehydrogenase [Clostridia bacterium]
MSRKLVVMLPHLSSVHQNQILAAAQAHGFEACFFDSAEAALSSVADAEIIFGQAPELARHAPRLQWLCSPFAGVDRFTQPGAFLSPDAVLTNSSGAYGVTIAEHIVMVALEMMRRQTEYNEIVSRRDWTRNLPVRSIKNSRITLLGTGDIGWEAAIRLRAFSPASIIGVNRSGKNPGPMFDQVFAIDRLDDLLPQTDLLILSLPGTPETTHIMNEKRLALLPRDAFLINVGRGNAVDERALEALLRSGYMAGAALDVFQQEPLPQDSSLWTCPRLLITPHVAGNMTLPYTVDRIIALFMEDFENYCAGRPLLRQVDLKKGY